MHKKRNKLEIDVQVADFKIIPQLLSSIFIVFLAPDAQIINRANEALWVSFPQNVISPWSVIGVKLYNEIKAGLSNSLNRSL